MIILKWCVDITFANSITLPQEAFLHKSRLVIYHSYVALVGEVFFQLCYNLLSSFLKVCWPRLPECVSLAVFFDYHLIFKLIVVLDGATQID